ncbi:hypothetical protein HDV05_001568 [Chytridiales sp. JEL 0842]|nr:hypothetical protein HDV05_001568 [Chytridiales sp. JEL 0842]
MSEIEEFDEQLQDLIEGVTQVLEREVPRLRGQERIEKCAYLKNRLTRSKQVHRSLLVEIRDLDDELKHDWEQKAKTYETTIAKLCSDVEWAETSVKGGDGESGGQKRKEVDDMTAKELTVQALQVQDQTLGSTARTKMIVEQTIEIGTSVNVELKKQGEQIQNIADGVEQVESNLKRADKQLRVFMRRMATDKIFLAFIFLIVVAIIVAVALYIVRKKTGIQI